MIIGAVMVPHPPIAVAEIGKGEEKKIQKTLDSFAKVSETIAELKPDTIVMITPHVILYRDWFNISEGSHAYGDFSRYGAGSVKFETYYDEPLSRRVSELCEAEGIPAGTQYDRDHDLDQGTMVPLYFINQNYRNYKLVRIGQSGLPLSMHYRFGMCIQKAAQESDKRILIVASGDLSHCEKEDGPYGYKPEGPAYDARLMKDMAEADFKALLDYEPGFLSKAEECGHRSFVIMAGILDRLAVEPEVLSHEATFGVGYGFVIYRIKKSDETRNFLDQYEEAIRSECGARQEAADPYVRLAIAAVRDWVLFHKRLSEPVAEELKNQRAGVFVSIHEFGELRGCIGTIEPVRSCIAEEIVANAISACSKDPRFEPVQKEELDFLEMSVDVLSPAEPVRSMSELDAKRYGVIVSSEDGRRGLLLPDLEGVDTPQEQIRIARSKAGIGEFETVRLERFEVIRHV